MEWCVRQGWPGGGATGAGTVACGGRLVRPQAQNGRRQGLKRADSGRSGGDVVSGRPAELALLGLVWQALPSLENSAAATTEPQVINLTVPPPATSTGGNGSTDAQGCGC